MKYYWFGFVVLLFSVNTIAQQKSEFPSEITLYFDSDKSVLKPGQDMLLTDFAQGALSLSSEYTIRIVAHTDSDGDVAYNEKLAIARAQEVIKLLTQQGLSLLKMIYVANGESVPVASNTTNDGKAKNRRVTITLIRPVLANTEERKDAKNTTFTFPVTTENHIETPSGTQLHIPENAFVDAAGNLVTGKVSIDYTEYRTVADFIFSDIPMNFKRNGEEVQFNSSGMFKIRATSKGEIVFLAPDKQISLDFPLEQTIPDTNFYFFDENKNEWIERSKISTDNENRQITSAASQNKSALDLAFSFEVPNESLVDGRARNMVFDCNDIRYKKALMDKLITSNDSISVLFRFTPVTNKPANSKKIKTLTKRIKILDTRLDAQTSSLKANELICNPKISDNLLSINILGNNYITNLNKINWRIQPNSPVILSPEMKLNVILYDDGIYTIQLEGNNKITKLFVKRPENSSEEIKNLINSCMQKLKSRKNIENQYATVISNTNKSITANQNQIRKLNEIHYITNDSLERLHLYTGYVWMINKDYMSEKEKKMKKEEWFQFFDFNRSLVGARFDSIIKSEEYIKCLEKKQKEYAAFQEEERVSNEIKRRFANITITGMGVYNCDQIYRLENPLLVDASYVNELREKIEPYVIFVVDKNINGVLRYDGYNGYSPYHFAFSPNRETKIIVFDKQAAMYQVKPENLYKVNREVKVYQFELEKIADFPDKSKVQKIL